MPESKRSSDGSDPGVWVTVLAGGIGSRFWPVSTPDRPKQLLPLASDRPLIVDTVERARALVPDERLRILAGAHLAGPFQSVLSDLPQSSYWIEPRARGTAPVLAWAAARLAEIDPDAVMVSVHADHLIEPLDAFQETVESAVEVARRDGLLLSIGVEPDRVETGYGHVEPGDPLPASGRAKSFRVRRFHEKPDAETAQRYVDAGYLWNTGIFVWKVSALLDAIRDHAPEVHDYLGLINSSDAAFFEAVPVSVIDRAVMERADNVGIVVATFAWDDVGSWEALARTRTPDSAGNVVLGEGRAVGGTGNVVYTEGGGSVVLFGTENMIVVQTPETTMVLPRERAPDLKKLLSELEGDAP